MRDDDDDDAKQGVHTVDTIPPPDGEDDVYGAKTQVGGLTPEALAMLRQIRDERPKGIEALEELNVPIFEEDEAPRPGAARIAPAAGRPAEASSTPKAPLAAPPAVGPKAPTPPRVSTAPSASAASAASAPSTKAPDPKASAPTATSAEPSGTPTPAVTAPVSAPKPVASPLVTEPAAPTPAAPLETPPLAALFGVTRSPPSQRELPALFDPEEPEPEEPEPASYVSVFAPIAGESAAEAPAPVRSGRSRGLMVVAALLVVGVVVVVIGQAGWITGSGHVGASSSGATTP